MNEQMTIAFFIDFDLILYIAIEKFKHFDDKNCEIIFVENIWFRNVTKKINETNCKTNKQIFVDFFAIWYTISDAKIRKFKLLKNFRTWCSRINSWNLLLKLKFCLQYLYFRTLTIIWIDNLFIDFNVISNVNDWKIVRLIFIFTRMQTIWIRIVVNHFAINFAFFANKTIVNFFAISHVKLIALFKKNEQLFENFWTKFFWNFDSNVRNDNFDEIKKHWIDLFFFDFDTIFDVWIKKYIFFCETIILKINFDSNICFDVAIKISNFCDTNAKNESLIVDFFFVSHVKFAVTIEKNELIIENVWSTIFENSNTCSNDVANETKNDKTIVNFFTISYIDLNVKFLKNESFFENFWISIFKSFWIEFYDKIKKYWNNSFFIRINTISNVDNEKIDRFNKMIDLNVVANSNIDFWNFVDKTKNSCETNDVFSILRIKLIVLIEKRKFLTNFEIS